MASADQWITLDDFSLGICADIHGGNQYGFIRNGAATIHNTVNCCADENGALVPLPKRIAGMTSGKLPEGNSKDQPAYYPTSMNAAYLIDAEITGPWKDTGSSRWASGSFPGNLSGEGLIAVFAIYNFYYNEAGTSPGTNYKNMWLGREWRQFKTAPDITDFLWESSNLSTYAAGTFPRDVPSGNLTFIRTTNNAAPTALTMTPTIVYAISGEFDHVAAIPASELPLSSYDTDVSGNYPAGNAPAFQGFLASYPNPSTPGLLSIFRPTGSLNPNKASLVVGHQDRAVAVLRGLYQTVGAYHIKDVIWYSPVLDFSRLNSFSQPYAQKDVFSENITGISIIVSNNYDELLLIKNHGGGVLIRGDLDNATLIRLPNIESCYGIASTPINTPIGLVYGTRNGVYVWQGGSDTPKLSTQIAGFFWDHTDGVDVTYEAHRGRFGYMHPWVAVPNNYFYDTRTKAWWRIETGFTQRYNVYYTDPTTGKLYAFPYKLTSTTNQVWDVYDPNILAGSYSWNSHPLVETRDTQRNVREVRVTASSGNNVNQCGMAVVLRGRDVTGADLGAVSVSFLWTGDGQGRPIMMRKDITNFNAANIQVFISANGSGGEQAPKVISVDIGYTDDTLLPKS